MHILFFRAIWLQLLLTLMTAPISSEAIANSFQKYQTKIDQHNLRDSLQSKDTLRVRLSHWPQVFHPYKHLNPSTELINGLIHASLLHYDQSTGSYQPYLAQEYSYSSQYKTLTFTLNQEAISATGQPLTPEDVVASFEGLLSPQCVDCASTAATMNMIKKVKALSDHRVRFQFHRPSQYHHRTIGRLPIIARDQDLESSITTGFGPYTIVISGNKKTTFGQSILFTRKPQLWMSQLASHKNNFQFPIIEAVYFHKNDLALKAFQKGHLSTLTFSHSLLRHWYTLSQHKQTLKTVEWVKYPQKSLITHQFMVWNPTHSETQDPRLRQALYHLFPEQEFLKLISKHDTHLMVSQPFSSAYPMSRPKRSLKKAQSLIRKILGLKSTEAIPTGSIELSFQYSDLDGSSWLTTYQDHAKKAGIKLNLVYRPLSEIISVVTSKNYDGILLSHTLQHPEDVYDFLHSQGIHNYWGLDNSDLDKNLEKLMITQKPRLKMDIEKKIAHLVLKSYSLMYLSRTKNHHMAYLTNKITPPQPPAYPYSGSDQHNHYYLHWQPPSN